MCVIGLNNKGHKNTNNNELDYRLVKKLLKYIN